MVVSTPPPDTRYLQPSRRHLAVLSCFFNPCGYQAPLRNFKAFQEHLAAQCVPLYILELAIGEQPFVLPPGPNVVQRRSESILFHKERLLNVLLPHIPDEFDSLAWIDGDLFFTNPRWAEEAEHQLAHHPVVQLFDRAEYLDRAEKVTDRRMGLAAAVATGHPDPRDLGRIHPGFAWAARREWWEQHGLFDQNILGSGDSDMVCGLFGWWEHSHLKGYPPAMKQALSRWGHRVWHDVRGRVGWVSGTVRHLWHGSLVDRQYITRWQALDRFQFQPHRDLRSNSHGIWEWTGANEPLEHHVRDYFLARREDA